MAFVILGAFPLAILTERLPLVGWDWYFVFYRGVRHMYPPWMVPILEPLRWVPWRWSFAWIVALTLLTVALTTAVQARRVRWDGLQAAAMALLTPPMFILLWDGQIDGLILAGLMLLPWSMPLVMLRPHIVAWMMLSRRSWTLAMGLWFGLSLLIWGWWVGESLSLSVGSITHPTAMGWATLGWPILLVGLAMWLASDGDPVRALAAGMIAAPYLQPYHMVLLLPALGRVSGWRRWLLWGWAWVLGLVPAFMGFARYLALGFPVAVWILTRRETPPEAYP